MERTPIVPCNLSSAKPNAGILKNISKSDNRELNSRFKTPSLLISKQKGTLTSQRFKTPSRPTKKSDIGQYIIMSLGCSLNIINK